MIKNFERLLKKKNYYGCLEKITGLHVQLRRYCFESKINISLFCIGKIDVYKSLFYTILCKMHLYTVQIVLLKKIYVPTKNIFMAQE